MRLSQAYMESRLLLKESCKKRVNADIELWMQTVSVFAFNVQDRVVCTKRDTLNQILEHMMIQVENPLAILTQDTARMFLSSSSPQDKYGVNSNVFKSSCF